MTVTIRGLAASSFHCTSYQLLLFVVELVMIFFGTRNTALGEGLANVGYLGEQVVSAQQLK